MSKRIAIITGATGGIGKEFTKRLLQNVDEIWAIARNEKKLAELKKELGDKIVLLKRDLSKQEELLSIEEILREQKPVISWLINNAGLARMDHSCNFSVEETAETVTLNCTVPVILCSLCIPYMTKGSNILMLSSAASFQPMPYLNLYSATKVFERYYARALNRELKGTGILAVAVCPAWVDTQLLMKEYNGRRIKFPGITTPERVVKRALKDAERGKDLSICSPYARYLYLTSRIFSDKAMMNAWVLKAKEFIK